MEVREPNARYLVKPAFKQTEVGVIPENWEVEPLGDLTTLMTNGFVGVATRHYAKNESGVLYIQGYNVEENAFNFHGVKYVTEAFHRQHLKSCLREGDLLTVQTGDVGLTTVITADLVGSNCHALIISRFDRKRAVPKYVSLYLNSAPGRARLKLIETGTTMKHLNVGDMLHFAIPLPSLLVEQQAIAEALSDADALIESLEQLLAKKRQIKQGAMQELLTGQKRLPGFEQKSGCKQTDLGSVPEDWDVIPIGQAAQCLIGLTYSPNDVRSFGTLVLRSSNVQNGCLAFDDNVYVEMELPVRVITQEDDILICVRNGSRQLIGKCALIDEAAAGSAFGAFMAVLRSKSSRFLFQQFQSHILKRQISDVMGATINQITNKDMAAFKVIWPVLESEQTAIATVLADLDAELAALETKLTKARQLKRGMMQELLTGRIRLV